MRPQSHQPSRRRAARTIAAAAAIGIGHLLALLILNTSVPKPGPQIAPAHADFLARLEPLQAAKPPPPPLHRRSRRPAPPSPAAAAPPALHQPPPGSVPAPLPAAPGPPDYGRWTVAPGSGPAQAPTPGLNLAGCSPASLSALTGAAHDACARRLAEAAKRAPALPPAVYPRDAQEQYAQAVRDWKTSSAMTAHPCPPQDVAVHKLYFDKCSLVNAARAAGGPLGASPGVKLEFKMKF